MRETWEEAGATVEVISPFAQLDIPLIGQVNHPTSLFLLIHIIVLIIGLVFLWSRRMLSSWQDEES